MTSISLNNIIDLSNDKIQKKVDESLTENQNEWINKFLQKEAWDQSNEFQQYISQFTKKYVIEKAYRIWFASLLSHLKHLIPIIMKITISLNKF